jgi:aspartate/methionine/tyrosine aminotransferase
MVIIGNVSVGPLTSPILSLQEQRARLRQLRHELIDRYRPHIYEGAGPIRVMARIVAELERECRKLNISEEVMRTEIVNRTIGDVNLRLVTECEGEAGSRGDYRLLADELGVALPGEQLHGYKAAGETYLWLRSQMMECEHLLLDRNFDLRIYDIYGIGNPLLREWLSQEMQQCGISIPCEQIYLSIGAMDGIDKVLRGVHHMYRVRNIHDVAILFPEPGFGVPEWQARSYGYRLHNFLTLPENNFKLTAAQLDSILQQAPDIHVLYLTITNNPSTFSYTPDELQALHSVLRHHREQGHIVYVLADLAYIGTGKPEEDCARMATFAAADVLQHTIFVSSYSKTLSLTGERFGWVTIGDPDVARELAASWTNSMASLPGEWQLRFMAYYRLFQARPWLVEKLRNLYRLRRKRLIEQLQRIDAEQHLFEQIYLDDDATVYNWSKLRAGEDAFSLFEKTGIAGVPGSGFGYSDEYLRFSIGVIPVPGASPL